MATARIALAFSMSALLLAQAYGQVERWSRTYGDSAQNEDFGNVIQHSDSNYKLVHGNTFFQGTMLDFVNILPNGDTLSSRHYEFQGVGLGITGYSDLFEQGDGSIWWVATREVIGGDDDAVVISFTAEGDTNWTRILPAQEEIAVRSTVHVPGSGALIIGSYYNGSNGMDMMVFRVDANAALLWTVHYGGDRNDAGLDCVHTGDGGFLISGKQYDISWPQDGDLFVMKLNDLGDSLWTSLDVDPGGDNSGGWITARPSGDMVVTGRRWIGFQQFAMTLQLDANGGVVQERVYQDHSTVRLVGSGVLTNDGGIVYSGFSSWGLGSYAVIFKVDSLGEEVWYREFALSSDVNSNNFFSEVVRTLDGGFLLYGPSPVVPDSSSDSWLLKTDGFGCLVPGCQIFDPVEEQFLYLSSALTAMPNPARDVVEVTIDIPQGLFDLDDPILTVADAEGRQHIARSVRDVSSLTLSLSSLASGVYFLHLTDGSRWLAGCRVVKE